MLPVMGKLLLLIQFWFSSDNEKVHFLNADINLSHCISYLLDLIVFPRVPKE